MIDWGVCVLMKILLAVLLSTALLTGCASTVNRIDDLQVKGKSVGLGIYTVLDNVKNHYNSSRKRHAVMHGLYRQKRFLEAVEECRRLKGQFEGKMDLYYDMWIERCEYMNTQGLPDNWSGVFVATSK